MKNTFYYSITCLIIILVQTSIDCIGVESKNIYAKKKYDQNCSNLADSSSVVDRCEFYKCFEDRFPCGKGYWILDWGFKYCKRFSDEAFVGEFTQNGRKIINHVNKCLPSSVKKLYAKSRGLNCKSLHENAFRFQQKCYEQIQNDFCIGFTENKSQFFKLIDSSDLSNLASLTMMKNVISKCTPKIDLFSLMIEIGK